MKVERVRGIDAVENILDEYNTHADVFQFTDYFECAVLTKPIWLSAHTVCPDLVQTAISYQRSGPFRFLLKIMALNGEGSCIAQPLVCEDKAIIR